MPLQQKRKLLVVTNLYPNSAEPVRGLYIRQLVEMLSARYEVRVVAPLPWVPKWVANRWQRSLLVPEEEFIGNIRVYHPRYLVIPKILRFSHGFAYAASLRRSFQKIADDFDFDLISVHWMFPDTFGTVLAAKSFDVPVVAHALGCDINDYIQYPLRRKMIRWALLRCAAVVTKSEEIATKVASLGIDRKKINVVHNGINKQRFHPRDKNEERRALHIPTEERIVLFVGNFAVEKGVSFLLQAFAQVSQSFDDAVLYLIGDGPLRAEIKAQIRELGIGRQTRLLGRVVHEEIPRYINSADVLCLPSLREGCPNVILESLASGTPVVASAVGAIPEMVRRTNIAVMVPPQDAAALAVGISRTLANPGEVGAEFDWPSWEQNAASINVIFSGVLKDEKQD